MKRIEILKEAHKLLKNNNSPGLCNAIVRVLLNNGVNLYASNILDYIPLFTFENAKKFGAEDTLYWWMPYRYCLFSGRRRFMRWLMWKYRNDKEEII